MIPFSSEKGTYFVRGRRPRPSPPRLLAALATITYHLPSPSATSSFVSPPAATDLGRGILPPPPSLLPARHRLRPPSPFAATASSSEKGAHFVRGRRLGPQPPLPPTLTAPATVSDCLFSGRRLRPLLLHGGLRPPLPRLPPPLASASLVAFNANPPFANAVAPWPPTSELAFICHPWLHAIFLHTRNYSTGCMEKMPSIARYNSAAARSGSMFVLIGCISFIAFVYAAVVSKWFPSSNNRFISAVQKDRYYCFLVPLTLPLLLVAVYFHWLSMKLFKHA